MNAHVLINFHVRAEKKVFNIARTVASTVASIRDGTDDVEFGVNNDNGRGANISIGIETITTDSHAKTVGFGLARAHGAHKVGVGNLAAGRGLVRAYEKHGAVANNTCSRRAIVGETSGAATPFVG